MRYLMILVGLVLAASAVSAASNCTVTYDAQNFTQFQAAVPQLNEQLSNCPITLPSGSTSLLGSHPGLAVTTNNAGYTFTIENRKLTGIEEGGTASLVFAMSPETFSTLSTADDKFAAFKAAYKKGDIWISDAGFFRKLMFHMGWWFASHFTG